MKPGDAVLCPSFTFAATAEVICWLGAAPVFVDVREDTFNLDIDSIEAGLVTARETGPAARGRDPRGSVWPAGGLCADRSRLPRARGCGLLADAAQSFGAQLSGPQRSAPSVTPRRPAFFPAKPLGCYGDGGAIFTDDSELGCGAAASLRNHGQGADKYEICTHRNEWPPRYHPGGSG